jgi:hypothetical protein
MGKRKLKKVYLYKELKSKRKSFLELKTFTEK